MEFTEVIVRTNQKNKESVLAVMQMVSNSFYIEDYENLEDVIALVSHVDLIDDELINKDRDLVIIHMYLDADYKEQTDFVAGRLKELDLQHEIEIKTSRAEDWAENWKQYYKPLKIGKSLIIKPEWETLTETNGRKILTIEPGAAFGTGQHETTKMCLELLESIDIKGKTVLDLGCGSGILSVAAKLLGAEDVTAVDIDPVAVSAAVYNAKLNGFTLNAIAGDLFGALTPKKYDIVMANIVADAILSICGGLMNHLNAGGVFICSGIIDERLDEVTVKIGSVNLGVREIRKENGWAAVCASAAGRH